MKTIVIASQKGGVGKTTLAAHLAVAAGKLGQKAALLDTDPQASLSDWWNDREAQDPPSLNVQDLSDLETIKQQCEAEGIKLLIVDTPPAYTERIQQAISVADLVVIPCRPSPHDLRAIGATVALAEAMKRPFLFVLNSVNQRAKVTSEALALLGEHGEVAPQPIANRTAFATSATNGLTIFETEANSPGGDEIMRLTEFILGRLKRKGKS